MINSISYKFRGFERLRTAERKGKSRKKKICLLSLKGQRGRAHLEVILDCLEVIHEESLTVWQEEGQQKRQRTGNQ